MPRKQKKIHYLYKTTCIISNRFYIGVHSTNDINDGYMGSGKRLHYSLRKYGINNHKKEILEFFDSRELLIEKEKEVVNSDLIKDKSCLNLVIGGGGFMLDDYHYECSKNGNKKHNEKLKTDSEYKKDWSFKVSQSLKKRFKDGKITTLTSSGWNKGVSTPDSVKLKISETNKGMGKGELNSQYGTCWVTKDSVNKKIKKSDLESWLSNGWSKGYYSSPSTNKPNVDILKEEIEKNSISWCSKKYNVSRTTIRRWVK